jgi:methylthioribose-1-phosphate isomerase
MALQSIVYDPGSPPESRSSLKILNQLLLPHQTVFVPIRNVRCAFAAIKQMLVRGAPAIALVAALALAVEDPWSGDDENRQRPEEANVAVVLELSAPAPPHRYLSSESSADETAEWYTSRLAYLVQSRPTAVNLADAARKLSTRVREAVVQSKDAAGVRSAYVEAAVRMLEDDVRDNENIGRTGRDWLLQQCQLTAGNKGTVLTHCNTG